MLHNERLVNAIPSTVQHLFWSFYRGECGRATRAATSACSRSLRWLAICSEERMDNVDKGMVGRLTVIPVLSQMCVGIAVRLRFVMVVTRRSRMHAI